MFFPIPNMLSVIPGSTYLFASTSIPVLLKWPPCCSRYTTHIELSLAACIIKGHISNIYWVCAVWLIPPHFRASLMCSWPWDADRSPQYHLSLPILYGDLCGPWYRYMHIVCPCNITIVYTPGSVQCLNNKCVFVNKLLGEFGNQYP